MTVIRNEDQTLHTEWFMKSIASGRMLNWHSFHLPKYKVNVARNFIHRVCTLSTNLNTAAKKKIIQNQLIMNGYPKTLINRIFHLYINQNNHHGRQEQTASITEIPARTAMPPTIQHQSSSQPTIQPSNPSIDRPTNQSQLQSSTCSNAISSTRPLIITSTDPSAPGMDTQREIASIIQRPPNAYNIEPTTTNHGEHLIYRSIPYVAGLSECIIHILNRDYNNITIACRQTKTIQRFHTPVKDPISMLDRSRVVYKIPCSNCKQCYIGMTNNRLQTRLYGHKTHINKLNRLKELGYSKTDTDMITLRERTALIEHCIDHDHMFNLGQVTVLDRSNHTNTLAFLEMCHITNTPHTVNHRTDVSGLNSTYAAILQTFCKTFQTHQTTNDPPSSNQPLPPPDV
ncbi:uncharacterized protein LOC134284948 [Aedes albopictus]|uniref:Helix-turn-helix domain-containing protein n=1 Tax=Aedes albopictus TaxID=7160 RepID=A0ABM1YLA9_AEDAL